MSEQPPREVLWLLGISALALAARWYAASHVGFGDSEALYACYALHPQASYLDHPGLVGVLARALGQGTAPTPLQAHVVTALAATFAPWALVLAARASGAGVASSLRAGLAVALVPEISAGLFAMTPDLPLFFAWVSALGCAAAGLRAEPSSGRAAMGLATAGLLAGVACAAKLTGVTLWLALFVTYLSRPARSHARTLWPWVGLGAGLLVVTPILTYEKAHGWPMLRHRLVDTQHGAGLSLRNLVAVPAGQLVYLSPFAACAVFMLARDLWRADRREVISRLLANATFLPLSLLLPLCLWSKVAEPHWLAPGLLALALHFARTDTHQPFFGPRFARWTLAVAGLASAAVYAWVLIPSHVALLPRHANPRFDLANELYGWPQAVEAVRRIAREERTPLQSPKDLVVVGPHWTVCGQLQAALRTELPVGCAGPDASDFEGWYPRAQWKHAETVLLVTDNRFLVDEDAIFPGRVRTRDSRLSVLEGGRIVRTFVIAVLERSAIGVGGRLPPATFLPRDRASNRAIDTGDSRCWTQALGLQTGR